MAQAENSMTKTNMRISISKVAPEDWDKRLTLSEFGTIYQSTMYADYLHKVRGWRPLFVELKYGEDLKAMALIFSQSQFFSQRLYNSLTLPARALFWALSKLKPLYWCYYGPVLLSNNYDTLEMFLQSLRSSFLFKRGSRIQFTPHPLDDKLDLFLKYGFSAKPLATCIIDLRQNLQVLRKKMNKKSTWKNAERALRKGVQIIEVNRREDFETYFQLLRRARQRLGIRPYTRREIFPILDTMIKKGAMKCFMAVKGERPLAGILISVFNGYLSEWGAAQALEDITGHFYANDLLRYHIIKWGHNMGYRYYDQSGLSFGTSWRDLGIDRYKMKWGGKIVHYHSYTISV